jgi:hypothetical protein
MAEDSPRAKAGQYEHELRRQPSFASIPKLSLLRAGLPFGAQVAQISLKKQGGKSMREDHLEVYLNDHLAELVMERELAVRCHGNNPDGALGQFLARLVEEIKDQEGMVREVLHRVGGSESMIKEGAAWLAEKVGRLKLNNSLVSYSDLSRVVELEGLLVAGHARLSLWQTAATVFGQDSRLVDLPFGRRIEETREQLNELDRFRLAAALEAFSC